MQSFAISPQIEFGPIRLITGDRTKMAHFYTEVIGLSILSLGGLEEDRIALGIVEDEPLVVLIERPNAISRPMRTTGLYHFAILVPTRFDLARSLARLNEQGYPLQGASDHLVSEALYLADPDGNGIEIYADRPRDHWQWCEGHVDLATIPLNVNDLIAELDQSTATWTGLPQDACLGHIHLHVSDLELAEAFYIHGLGFTKTARYGSSATFVSAGGYHHHIGMNTWIGAGAPSPPKGAVGMQEFTIYLPDEASLDAFVEHLNRTDIAITQTDAGIVLNDPSNNRILVAAKPTVGLTSSANRAIAQ